MFIGGAISIQKIHQRFQHTQAPEFIAFEARLRRELHLLSAALKRSVPFHSPRYLGHMVSDLALPGLVAQMLTLPYNPNNVSEDAAPVTIDLEIKVGARDADDRFAARFNEDIRAIAHDRKSIQQWLRPARRARDQRLTCH